MGTFQTKMANQSNCNLLIILNVHVCIMFVYVYLYSICMDWRLSGEVRETELNIHLR